MNCACAFIHCMYDTIIIVFKLYKLAMVLGALLGVTVTLK